MIIDKKMRKLDEWAKDKPLGLVIFAQQAAVGVEALVKWLKSIKMEERLGNDKPPVPLKEWLSLYKNHKHLQKRLVESFRGLGGIAEYGANLAELIFDGGRYIRKMGVENFKKEMEKLSAEEWRKNLEEGQKHWGEIYKLHLDDIQLDIDGKIDEDLNKKLKEALTIPEMIFFLKVWTPCFFQYGEYPGKLLRKARLGDMDAIEKILRVDASVIGDPKICERFYRESWKRDKVDFNTMAKALQRGPKGKGTRRQGKYKIAGFISSVWSSLGTRITEPEIRELYDAVAHDLRKEDIDGTLPDAPESFSKQIQRYRSSWISILQPDKK
jgi:hypothetical protein